MQNFTICVPDKVVGDKDFENYAYMCDKEDKICYPEPMLYGCQFMPTCYFNENDLAVYNDIFEKFSGIEFFRNISYSNWIIYNFH